MGRGAGQVAVTEKSNLKAIAHLLQRGEPLPWSPGQQLILSADASCPLFKQFYNLTTALKSVLRDPEFLARFDDDTLLAGLLLARSRESAVLGKQRAADWLSKAYSLKRVPHEARIAAEMYFIDSATVQEDGEDIYDPDSDKKYSAKEIRKHLDASMRKSGRDIWAYLDEDDGYYRRFFLKGTGERTLLMQGTPIVWLGELGDEEILVPKEVPIRNSRSEPAPREKIREARFFFLSGGRVAASIK